MRRRAAQALVVVALLAVTGPAASAEHAAAVVPLPPPDAEGPPATDVPPPEEAPASAVTPVPSGTEAPPASPGSWFRIDSPHFSIYSDAQQQQAAALADRLERFRTVLSGFHPGFVVPAVRPAAVYFFKNTADRRPYKMRFGDQDAPTPGVYRQWEEADVMMLDAESESDGLERVFGGLTWAFLAHNPARLPRWFESGVVDLYSVTRIEGSEATVGLPIADLLKVLRGGPLLPLAEMFFLDPASHDRNPGLKSRMYDAESWALAQYLLVGSERKPQAVEWLDRLLAGAEPEAAFHGTIKGTDQELIDELQAYVRASRMPSAIFQSAPGAAPPAAPKAAPVGRDEILARLGDVLAHLDRNRADDAAAILAEALRLNPSQGLAFAALGYMSEQSGDQQRAAEQYDKAASLSPNDVTAGYRCALYLLEHYEPPKTASAPPPPDLVRARSLLKRIRDRNPAFAAAFVLDGKSYLKSQEDPAPGIALLEKARGMLPARSDLLVDLVRLYVRKGDGARAAELADKVLPIRGTPMQVWGARIWLGRYDAPIADPDDDGSVRLLEERLSTTTDAAERTAIRQRIDGLHKLFLVDKHTVIFNKAIDLANTGRYTEAAGLLEKFLPEVADPDLQARFRDLAARLRDNAARLQGQGKKPI